MPQELRTNDTLATLLRTIARKRPPQHLALAALFGSLLVAAAFPWHGGAAMGAGAVGVCVLSFGIWARAEQALMTASVPSTDVRADMRPPCVRIVVACSV